jgi:hypothetical protein
VQWSERVHVLHYDALDKNLLQCEVLFAYTTSVEQSNWSVLYLKYQNFTLHLSLPEDRCLFCVASVYPGEILICNVQLCSQNYVTVRFPSITESFLRTRYFHKLVFYLLISVTFIWTASCKTPLARLVEHLAHTIAENSNSYYVFATRLYTVIAQKTSIWKFFLDFMWLK